MKLPIDITVVFSRKKKIQYIYPKFMNSFDSTIPSPSSELICYLLNQVSGDSPKHNI